MWYIDAGEDVRRKRLKDSRGYSDEKIDNILKSQKTKEELVGSCDYCIDNSGELAGTFAQINKILAGK